MIESLTIKKGMHIMYNARSELALCIQF